MAGKNAYQATYAELFMYSPSLSCYYVSGVLINVGYTKIAAYVGNTIILPIIYQSILFPHFVVIESLKTPTIGVVIASAIYPDNKHKAACVFVRLTTLIRYHVI